MSTATENSSLFTPMGIEYQWCEQFNIERKKCGLGCSWITAMATVCSTSLVILPMTAGFRPYCQSGGGLTPARGAVAGSSGFALLISLMLLGNYVWKKYNFSSEPLASVLNRERQIQRLRSEKCIMDSGFHTFAILSVINATILTTALLLCK